MFMFNFPFMLGLAPSTQTKLMDPKSGWSNTITYSTEVFGNRPPLIFGSVVVRVGGKTKMLVKDQLEIASPTARWSPKLYVISQESCEDFVFEEVSVLFATVLLMVLHIKDRKRPTKGALFYVLQAITFV